MALNSGCTMKVDLSDKQFLEEDVADSGPSSGLGSGDGNPGSAD